MGYESRSKAIQDAVRLFVSERKGIQVNDNSEQTDMIVMVYDHDTRNLESELTDTQQHHPGLAICIYDACSHKRRDCLEAIAVKGKVSEIRKLSDELATKRGA